MNTRFLKDAFGWGFLLWLIGYILGFVFFFLVPPAMIGWIILPIGTALTAWVLFRIVKGWTFGYALGIATVWTLLAVVLDGIFIVKLLHPSDGYYKLDVFLYYGLTFILPLFAWLYRRGNSDPRSSVRATIDV